MSRRARRFAVRAALVAPRLLPVVAVEVLAQSAQPVVAWEAGGGLTRGPGATGEAPVGWRDDGRLGSALRWSGPFGALSFDGAAALRGGAWQGAGRASALVVTPAWRGLRLSVSGEGRLAPVDAPALLPIGALATPSPTLAPDARAQLAGDARLSWARGRGGMWLGVDGARARRVRADDAPAGVPATAALRPRAERIAAGAWRQLGGLVLGVTFGSRAVQVPGSALRITMDSVPNGTRIRADSSGPGPNYPLITETIWKYSADTTAATTARLRRWSEIEARAGWARGRVTLDAAAGLRPRFAGVAGAAWLEGTGSLAFGSRTALVAGGGTLPARTAGGVARTFFTLGLRVAPRALHRPLLPPVVRPVATDFEVRGAPAGQYVFSVRLPGARGVELSGDFTGWKPVALRQVSADRWEVALPVTPGTHRCNVRVDGDRWIAPPGTTTVDDDFNGVVGLIVVP
jgi:hypothetical protein